MDKTNEFIGGLTVDQLATIQGAKFHFNGKTFAKLWGWM